MGTILRTVGIALALLALISGCSTTPRRGGAKLSDAAGEASKPRQEQEKLKLGEVVEEEDQDDEQQSLAVAVLSTLAADDGNASPRTSADATADVSPLAGEVEAAEGLPGTVPPAAPAEQPRSTLEQWQEDRISFTPSWFYGELAGDALARYRGFSMTVHGYPESRLRAGGGIYFLWPDVGTSPAISPGLLDFSEIGLVANARYYATKDQTFMGLYALGGIRFGLFNWDYATPLSVVNDDGRTEEIDHDNLYVWGLLTGVGASPIQIRHLHVGASVIVGLRFYGDTTTEGFENDLFADVGYTQFQIETSYFF
jgi:hypothetical protein